MHTEAWRELVATQAVLDESCSARDDGGVILSQFAMRYESLPIEPIQYYLHPARRARKRHISM